MGILTKIEDLIGQTVESWFDVKKDVQPLDIARMAKKVLADSKKKLLDKIYIANAVTVVLDKKAFEETQPLHDKMISQLKGSLTAYAEEMDYHTIGNFTVYITSDLKLKKQGVKIIARMLEDEKKEVKLSARLYFEKENREVLIFHTGKLFIGRDEGCHVVIKHSRVSGRHAIVSLSRNRVSVADLKSAHGIEVNGKRVSATEVETGDTLTIAGVEQFSVEVIKRDKIISSVVLTGDKKTHMMLKDDLLIGRKQPQSKLFDLAFPDDAVSARYGHARIEYNKSVATVIDLKSTNGTMVNGERISSRELKSGDRVTLGETEFYFYYE